MTTTARLDYSTLAPDVLRAMYAASAPLKSSGLGEELLELCRLRASQINGCVTCVDLHARTLRAAGVDTFKVDLVAVWREANVFTERERAALGWTEALTRLSSGDADDASYAALAAVFDPREQIELTHNAGLINLWNRLNVAFRTPPLGKTVAELTGAAK